ncbi:MAG: NAD(+)/NADH kinase, partial [Actinomycetota bacterium]|nr:NAD(+)/NADH kinase [Actinomycetota bacterium]
MAVIGLVVHELRQEAIDQAAELAQWLSEEGHEVHHPLIAEKSRLLDLVVSLGGDGSILRAVDLLGDSEVPILGVNFGHLGYLTACEPSEVKDLITQVLDG